MFLPTNLPFSSFSEVVLLQYEDYNSQPICSTFASATDDLIWNFVTKNGNLCFDTWTAVLRWVWPRCFVKISQKFCQEIKAHQLSIYRLNTRLLLLVADAAKQPFSLIIPICLCMFVRIFSPLQSAGQPPPWCSI